MNSELRYAAGFAALTVAYTMVEHVLGFNSVNHEVGQYTRLAGIVFPVAAVYLGIRSRRAQRADGSPFTFVSGLRTGFIVALVLSVITALWFLLYGNVINPEFLGTLLEFEKDRMIAAGTPEAEVAANIDRLRTMYSFPVQPVVQTLLGVAYGTFFAAVFAILMRRKGTTAADAPPPPDR